MIYSAVQCTEEKVSEIVHMQNAEFCIWNQAENIYIFERKQASMAQTLDFMTDTFSKVFVFVCG